MLCCRRVFDDRRSLLSFFMGRCGRDTLGVHGATNKIDDSVFLSLIFNMELRMHNGKFEGNNWWCFVNEFVKISLREPSETGVELIY